MLLNLDRPGVSLNQVFCMHQFRRSVSLNIYTSYSSSFNHGRALLSPFSLHPGRNPQGEQEIWGKLFGDKGYISKNLFEMLFVDGIHLITKIRNNMKNSLMDINDKILLRKRALIETINDELKNICQIEHSRHRSQANFLCNTIAGLVAYSFLPKKPAIKCQFVNSKQLAFC